MVVRPPPPLGLPHPIWPRPWPGPHVEPAIAPTVPPTTAPVCARQGASDGYRTRQTPSSGFRSLCRPRFRHPAPFIGSTTAQNNQSAEDKRPNARRRAAGSSSFPRAASGGPWGLLFRVSRSISSRLAWACCRPSRKYPQTSPTSGLQAALRLCDCPRSSPCRFWSGASIS